MTEEAVMRKCRACQRPFAETAMWCPACDFPVALMKACVICGDPMPRAAQRCNKCDAYQDGVRRWFPISGTTITLVAALLAVLSTIKQEVSNLINLESQTRFKMTNADDLRMYLTVWNTGQKPSALVGYRLDFGALPIEEAPLTLADEADQQARNVIFHGAPVRVSATTPELALWKPGHRQRYSKEAIRQLLGNGTARLTLKVDVEESNDTPDGWRSRLFGVRAVHTRTDTFPAATVAGFILGRMSG